MKNKILTTSLLAFLALSTSSFASDINTDNVEIVDNATEESKDNSLAEASELLRTMNNKGKSDKDLLSKYMDGEISAEEGTEIETGDKTEEEVSEEKNAYIEEEAQEEADEIIEKEKEKAFLKDKKPSNEELAEKFAKGEITAGQGLEMEKKMKDDKVSSDEAKQIVLKEAEEREAKALEDDGIISKIKSLFK